MLILLMETWEIYDKKFPIVISQRQLFDTLQT